MEKKVTTSKIIVDESNEITDLVRKIRGSKAERLVLTFTEHTDILISPVNLALLQETVEREDKLLIAQIIQNPTGVRNAKIAGIKTIDTPSNPTESDWEEALETVKENKKRRKARRESIVTDESIKGSTSSFEENIDTSFEKPAKKDYVDRRGIKPTASFISIDGDLPSTKTLVSDMSSEQETPPATPKKEKASFKPFAMLKSFGKKKTAKLILLIGGPLLFLVILGFLLYNQFATLVRVKIFVESKPVKAEIILDGKELIDKVDFENLSVPIKTEKETKSLSHTINATGKSYKGERAKGTVELTFYYKEDSCPIDNPPKVVLNVGHILKSDNLQFKVTERAEILCNDRTYVKVEASDVGDNYNIPAKRKFSVENFSTGYSEGEVSGRNEEAFTGGSKEEYTVLSQQDVDKAVEELSITAIEEIKSSLMNKSSNWEIIEDSITSEVDKDSIKTDKKIGTEASTVNLNLTVEGSAIYYSTSGLADGLTELLRKEAEERNLFESERDLDLVLGDNIEKKVSVESSTAGKIKIKVEASSSVRPKVDKNELEEELKKMKWDEGVEYINSLNYAKKESEVVFNPRKYPSFLKRFPKRRGGVIVSVLELEVEE
ncbi:hypothetical protein GX888_02535 [Candidatus Dojkabacteria bacterium]|uniref:Baseplate protein J-like domain-containing protein n=1 Tax=Candidatus Dojkabacteria bacterium TaxID=2099670 RepID=A0A847VDI1_9BACT|nr:hypothetical protein [Candidatus Dojkabacteria bacterium]